MVNETGIPAEALDRGRVFSGSKAAVFLGDRLAVLLRDDKPGIPWPGMWDFPGGGRDPGESAVDCLIREAREELALELVPGDLVHARHYGTGTGEVWFFAARLPPARAEGLVLGDEGQAWALMTPAEFLADPRHIPTLGARLRQYLEGRGA